MYFAPYVLSIAVVAILFRYILDNNIGLLNYYLEIARSLRAEGIPTEVYLQKKRLGDQFSYASKLGIPFVVVAGAAEIEAGRLTLRDMRTGSQSEIPREELPERIRECST